MALLIKDNKSLPSSTFGDESLPVKNLYECQNVLQVFKIFVMPFRNAKLES